MKSQSSSIFSTEKKPTARHSDAGNLFIVPYLPQALAGCAGAQRCPGMLRASTAFELLPGVFCKRGAMLFPTGGAAAALPAMAATRGKKGLRLSFAKWVKQNRHFAASESGGQNQKHTEGEQLSVRTRARIHQQSLREQRGGKRSEDSPSGSIRP